MAGGLKFRPIPLIGGIAVAVSAALPWIASVGPVSSQSGFKVPFEFLIDPLKANGGIKVGLVVLLIGLIGAALTFVPATGLFRRLLGAVAVAVGGVYLGQLAHFVSRAGAGVKFSSVIGFGVYVTIGGGVLLAAGR